MKVVESWVKIRICLYKENFFWLYFKYPTNYNHKLHIKNEVKFDQSPKPRWCRL